MGSYSRSRAFRFEKERDPRYTRTMTWGHPAAVAAIVLISGLAPAGCAKKPAQKAEAGQVAAAAPLATPTTEEGCRACNGVFGVHGLDQTPKCVCRTTDGGKKCRGKDDCEADCIGDGAEREVTQPGPPPLGFWIGRCAEMRTTFGCHVFLPPKSAQPVRLDEQPGQLCVD
jgi:hypothetical protein